MGQFPVLKGSHLRIRQSPADRKALAARMIQSVDLSMRSKGKKVIERKMNVRSLRLYNTKLDFAAGTNVVKKYG